MTADTASGSRVSEAASSGEAAVTIPCPVMATPVDASSTPSPRPMVGADWAFCVLVI